MGRTEASILTAILDKIAETRNARWAFSSQLVTSAANLLSTLIIVRYMGVADFGRYTICFLVMMITRTFLGAAVLAPMSTIAPKLRLSSVPAYRGFLIMNTGAFSLGSSILLVATSVPFGLLLNAPWLPTVVGSLACANAAANGADFLRRYHFVYMRPMLAFLVDAVRHGFNIVLLLVCALAGDGILSLNVALWILATGSVLGMCVGAARFGKVRRRTHLWAQVWPRHWNFIRHMVPSTAVDILQNSGLFLAGGSILGEVALGRVRAMQSIANAVNLPFNALQEIAPTMASAAFSTGGHRAMNKLFRRMILGASLFAFLVSGLIVIFHEELIARVFGLSAAENLDILLMALALNLLVLFRLPIILGLQSLERLRALWVSGIVGLITAYGALYALASQGAEAILYARGLSFFLSIAVLIWAYRYWMANIADEGARP